MYVNEDQESTKDEQAQTAKTTDEKAQAATEKTEEDGGAQDAQKTFDAEYVRKLRGEAAKERTEKKALADRLQALEQAEEERKRAEMTETEQIKADLAKVEQRAQEAEERANTLEVEARRRRIASDENLPAEMIEFITATGEDDIKAQVKKLAKHVKPGALPRTGERSPAGGEQQKGFTDEEKKAASRHYAARF